jgi:hypothetical protein
LEKACVLTILNVVGSDTTGPISGMKKNIMHKYDIFGSEVSGKFWTKLWWTFRGYRPNGLINRDPEVGPGKKLRLTSYFWEKWEKPGERKFP